MTEKKSGLSQPIKESLAENIFHTLRRAITKGELKPGEWLRQENLAKELDVSQATVRDALNKLVGEGLAERIPYKGVHVAKLTANELEDIYAMRAVLEGMAAQSAANNISAEELQKMRELLPETIVNNDPSSISIARIANRNFHLIFIKASQRRFLIRILRQILDWIDPLMLYNETRETKVGIKTRLKWGERDRFQHTRLLKALEEGNGQLASQYATEAVEEAWQNLADLIFENSNNK